MLARNAFYEAGRHPCFLRCCACWGVHSSFVADAHAWLQFAVCCLKPIRFVLALCLPVCRIDCLKEQVSCGTGAACKDLNSLRAAHTVKLQRPRHGGAPADGRPVTANDSKMGAYSGLLGGTAPKIAFLFANSKMEPTCTAASYQPRPRL